MVLIMQNIFFRLLMQYFSLDKEEFGTLDSDVAYLGFQVNQVLSDQINHNMVDAPMSREVVDYHQLCQEAYWQVVR